MSKHNSTNQTPTAGSDRKQLNMSLTYQQYAKLVSKYRAYVRKCKDMPLQFAAWARDEFLNKI